jgi:UDP-N-acetylmuramoylalanine--D-glutamate ligase
MWQIMNITTLKNKKIGIWGFGIVGNSYYTFCQSLTSTITIMDKNTIQQLPDRVTFVQETPQNIQFFLQDCDFILLSPGISTDQYTKWNHKFVTELDLFTPLWSKKITAITGSLGKTTTTSLLEQLLQKYGFGAKAAGNIGNAMLTTIPEQAFIEEIILELSSFQLTHTQHFNPHLAIWTNLHENHLDYHKTFDNYFLAKKNIIAGQSKDRVAILPAALKEKLGTLLQTVHWIFTDQDTFSEKEIALHHHAWLVHSEKITHYHKQKYTAYHAPSELAQITFTDNWLTLYAALYVHECDLQDMKEYSFALHLPAHRLKACAQIQDKTFYNDSKSTVWQATLKAAQSLPIYPAIIFIGGVSKGVNRAPLFAQLDPKKQYVYLFGKEADELAQYCTQNNLQYKTFATLEDAFASCIQEKNIPTVLFSPGGASFDLFSNYIERGKRFEDLVNAYKNMVEPS